MPCPLLPAPTARRNFDLGTLPFSRYQAWIASMRSLGEASCSRGMTSTRGSCYRNGDGAGTRPHPAHRMQDG
jgi:hypothetical protein